MTWARSGQRAPSDPRYSRARWKALSRRIRKRDGRCMVVDGCPRGPQVADHIVPVYPGMPDAEFYAPANLRAACYYHNSLRGHADRAAREMGEAPVFSAGTPVRERALALFYTREPTRVITGDMSRKDGDRS